VIAELLTRRTDVPVWQRDDITGFNGASLESEGRLELGGYYRTGAVPTVKAIFVSISEIGCGKTGGESPTLLDVMRSRRSVGVSGTTAAGRRTLKIFYEDVWDRVWSVRWDQDHRAWRQDIMATNANRKQYVDLFYPSLYRRLYQTPSDPLKRGFLKVCGGVGIGHVSTWWIDLDDDLRNDFNTLISEPQGAAVYDDGYGPGTSSDNLVWVSWMGLSLDQRRNCCICYCVGPRSGSGVGDGRFQ
jgi:hypothetical protein